MKRQYLMSLQKHVKLIETTDKMVNDNNDLPNKSELQKNTEKRGPPQLNFGHEVNDYLAGLEFDPVSVPVES